jgi:hypothetical protein
MKILIALALEEGETEGRVTVIGEDGREQTLSPEAAQCHVEVSTRENHVVSINAIEKTPRARKY